MKYRCLNPECPRFGESFHVPSNSSPRCVECGWYTHRNVPLFDVSRLLAAIAAGAMIGWALHGRSEDALVGSMFGFMTYVILGGDHHA